MRMVRTQAKGKLRWNLGTQLNRLCGLVSTLYENSHTILLYLKELLECVKSLACPASRREKGRFSSLKGKRYLLTIAGRSLHLNSMEIIRFMFMLFIYLYLKLSNVLKYPVLKILILPGKFYDFFFLLDFGNRGARIRWLSLYPSGYVIFI